MPEVLVLMIVFGGRMASMRVIRSRLIFKFSMIASMTQSADLMTSRSSSRLPIETKAGVSEVKNDAGRDLIARSKPCWTIRLRTDFILQG